MWLITDIIAGVLCVWLITVVIAGVYACIGLLCRLVMTCWMFCFTAIAVRGSAGTISGAVGRWWQWYDQAVRRWWQWYDQAVRRWWQLYDQAVR